MSAHTPGPWTQSGAGIIRGANGVVVADARTEAGVRSDHERAANVALLVRAPEIPELEAQRDALAYALAAALPLLADSFQAACPALRAEIRAVVNAATRALRKAGKLP